MINAVRNDRHLIVYIHIYIHRDLYEMTELGLLTYLITDSASIYVRTILRGTPFQDNSKTCIKRQPVSPDTGLLKQQVAISRALLA